MSMKKSLKFVKYALLCVVSLGVMATGFTSCKDYDDDIDDLQKQIDAANSTLAELKAAIGDKAVAKMEQVTDGFKFTLVDGTSYTIKTGGTTPGTGTWTIGADGYWYQDGTKTPYLATGANPRVSVDGYWEFPTGIVENGEIKFQKSTIVATGAYVIDRDSYYELWIATKDSATLQPIRISKGSAGLGKIDLLGWITGYDDPSDDISANNIENAVGDTYEVNYALINGFKVEAATGVAGTGGTTAAAPANFTWSAMTDIVKGQVLNTLPAEHKGFLIEVYPTSIDASSLNFRVENSKGEILPISVGTPQLVTGYMTKANGSALYFLPTSYTADIYASTTEYDNLFLPATALYTITETTTGFRTNYSPWTAISSAVTGVVESPVNEIGGQTILAATGSLPSRYGVKLNTDVNVGFGLTANDAKNGVVDYYVEVKDASMVEKFGFSTDKKAGTFKVTKLPDDISLATFTLSVYKMAVDGQVFYEEVVVGPLRDSYGDAVYNWGNLTIKDAVSGTISTSKYAKGLLPAKAVDLTADMYTALGSKLNDWLSSEMGARSITFTLTRDDDATKANLLTSGAAHEKATITVKDKDGAVIAPADYATPATGKAFNARKIEIALNYVKTPLTTAPGSLADAEAGPGTTGDPVLARDKAYTLTMMFNDKNGSPLNKVEVKFTPVIPSLATMIAKRPAFFNADQSVLNAYFPEGLAMTPRWTAGTPIVYNYIHSIYPMNIGFSKLGSLDAADRTVVSLGLNYEQKIKKNNGSEVALGTNATDMYATFDGVSTDSKLGIWMSNTARNTETPGTGEKPAYGDELETSFVTPGYLYGLYPYTSAELDVLEIATKPMSATYEGTVETNSGTTLTIPASGVNVTPITKDMIWGKTYNDVRYEIFPSYYAGAVGTSGVGVSDKWSNGYVMRVQFAVDASGDPFQIMNQDGSAEITEPVVFTDGATPTPGLYMAIGVRSSSPSSASTGKLKVTVTDIYGYSKTTTITLNFTVGQ